MTFGRIDDGLCTNRKVCQLVSLPGGREALGLWTLGNSWSNRELADGFVPSFMIAQLGGWKIKHAELLVTVGLWEKAEGGYLFHDWSHYNETREQVEAKRRKTTERVRDWRTKNGLPTGEKSVGKGSVTALPTPLQPAGTPAPNPNPNPNSPVAPTTPGVAPLGADPAAGPEDPPPETPQLLVRQFHAELLGGLGTFPSQTKAVTTAREALAEWAQQFPDPKRALQAAFLGFREDSWATEKRYPLSALANETSKYHVAGLEMLAAEGVP